MSKRSLVIGSDGLIREIRDGEGPLSSVPVNYSDLTPGATPPTAVTIGTAPVTDAWLMDATAESMRFSIPAPADFDLTQDATLYLNFALTGPETNADQLDMTLNYRIPQNGIAADVLKTATSVAGAKVVTTAAGLTAGTPYQITFALPKDDGDNPFALASTSIKCEVNMTNLTAIAEIHLMDGFLLYTS